MTSSAGSAASAGPHPAPAPLRPKPVSRLSALIRLLAPWKWRSRRKKGDQSSRSQERRISMQASKEDLIQRGVLLPDLKSDFTPKHQQLLDICSLPAAGAADDKRDGGQSASASATAGAGLSRVSPATSHLTGAVATCLVGMSPLLRSAQNGRPATDSDLSDFSSQSQETSHKSHSGLTAAAMSRHSPSLAERAVLSAISAELQLNFLEARNR